MLAYDGDEKNESQLPDDVAAMTGAPGWHVGRKGRQIEVKFYSKEFSQPQDQKFNKDFPFRSTWIKVGDYWESVDGAE